MKRLTQGMWIFIAALFLSLAACGGGGGGGGGSDSDGGDGGGGSGGDIAYTVSFDSQGGSPIASIYNVTNGSAINNPDAPVWAGNSFQGWYTDTGYGTQWVFGTSGTPVTADIILYARWQYSAKEMEDFDDFGPNPVITETKTIGAGENLQSYLNGLTPGNYVVNLTGNPQVFTSATVILPSGVKVSLRGGYTISIDNSLDTMFDIQAGRKLIIREAVLQGRSGAIDSLIKVSGSAGEIVLRAGSIKDHENGWGYGKNGGGVNVYNNGTFTMSGGTISGNTANYGSGGGGVNIKDGIFTMSGGSISGNTADRGGGGVNIEGKDGIFTMNGGTISGNHGNSWGGGVNVDEGIFTMSGGSISGNTVSSGAGYPIRVGGGVMIELGTFNMSGGIIDGNTAPYGGGVYVDDGDFYKTGGIIYGRTPEGAPNWNRAGSDTRGHAVYADGGNSSLSNAKYRDTTAGSEVNLTAVKGAATGDGWMP